MRAHIIGVTLYLLCFHGYAWGQQEASYLDVGWRESQAGSHRLFLAPTASVDTGYTFSLYTAGRAPTSNGGLFSMIGAFHANSIYLIEAGTFESTEEHFPRYFVNLKVVLDSGGTTGFAVGIMDLPDSHLHRDDRLRALYFVFTFHGSIVSLNVSGALLPSFERNGILGGVGASLGVMITPTEKLAVIGEFSFYVSDTSIYARSGQGGWFYGIRYAVFESLAVQLAGVSGTVDNRGGPSFIGGVHYTVFSQ